MDASAALQKIHDAWNKGVSHSDLYTMIIEWITTYKYEIPRYLAPEIKDTESINEIVESFIYGLKWELVREYFKVAY